MPKILAFARNRRRLFTDNDDELNDIAAHLASEARITGQAPHERAGANHRRSKASTPPDLLISVVIATRNAPHLLNRCLASLVLQRFDPQRFEIIVVDNQPRNETQAVVERWILHTATSGPEVLYLPSAGLQGTAAARNLGWQAARGKVIAFTDDDTIAAPDWLKNGLRLFRDDAQAAWGNVIMPQHGPPENAGPATHYPEEAGLFTANCFCRKHVLEDIGGFDERFRYTWRENADLYFRLLDYPGRIVHAPHAVITHSIRSTSWRDHLAQIKKIQFDALLFKKHPTHYRQQIRPNPYWDYYLPLTALVTWVVALTLEIFDIATLAGLIWIWMTARFCLPYLRQGVSTVYEIAAAIATSAVIPPIAAFWLAVGTLRFRMRRPYYL